MHRIRVLTDGKAGDLVQCLGVAEAIVALEGGSIEERVVRPRAPFVWLMPWGPADPRDGAAIAPPYPAIAIASGRRAVASLRALKRRAPETFTVFLKDPRSGVASADFVWVPEHDRLRGDNVMTTPTSPHRVTALKLAQAAMQARPEIAALASPRVAVLIGGPSKDVAFGAADVAGLCDNLARLAASGAGLMVTPSRRTPAGLMRSVAAALEGSRHWMWNGQGDNPYLEMLALADAVVVTADSVNMMGEAAATGRPIHVHEPADLSPKVRRFVASLKAHGAVAKFEGRLETLTYEPLDSTPLIAREILARFHRLSRGGPGGGHGPQGS
jgi:mitochondrial fission protein ELM1